MIMLHKVILFHFVQPFLVILDSFILKFMDGCYFILSGISAEMRDELKDIVKVMVYEHLNKKTATPGKGDAVFLLRFNGDFVGSCFAIDETHVLSARHNMYENSADFGANDTAEVVSNMASSTSSVGPAAITVKISACLNPPSRGSISDSSVGKDRWWEILHCHKSSAIRCRRCGYKTTVYHDLPLSHITPKS
jgi:hypothetical protein